MPIKPYVFTEPKAEDGDLVFVYGSLRKGMSNDISSKEDAEFVGDDLVNGDMFDLGYFPGVCVLRGDFDDAKAAVFGEVYSVTESIISRLDRYEGHPGYFRRIRAWTASGLPVWVYTFPHDTRDRPQVLTGDWVTYRKEKDVPGSNIVELHL